MHKKVWATGIAVLLGAVVALAQPVDAQAGGNGAGAGQHRGAGQLKKLADYLGLTDDQKAQIKPILQGERQQIKTIRADTTLTPAQKQAKIKDIRNANRQQIMGILTPDQKAKLAALRHHKNGQGGTQPTPAG